ncbi:MAG TPA: TIGR03557 family F420-dependent LLM class oxidoreductase [Acidimicrobiales bacterium]|nr:TIGR03557 family F420-dependent LLM class oxidoreductase [Acidimicrobiales bacterium]
MTEPFRLGYWLSSEEHPPRRLVALAVEAERSGFATAMISDHFHPWVEAQGQAPFVWGVLGAIAQATDALEVGTGVTAPIQRLHPAVVAQAAATAAALMPGRFFLGLGTGERLNEHITGEHWPTAAVRRAMLEEAIGIIRRLFEGGNVNHRGEHFVVEHAQLFSLPDEPPPLFVAAGGKRSAALAGRVGDGLIGVEPSADVIDAFEANGGAGKHRFGQIHVCVDDDAVVARRTAHRVWPNGAFEGTMLTELPRPTEFGEVASLVSEDQVAAKVVCGTDVERHLEAIASFAAAGFDRVYVHQVGPDQERFFRFYRDEIVPRLASPSGARR